MPIQLTDDQREAQPLLEPFGVILLPDDIEDAFYLEFAWALKLGREIHPNIPLRLEVIGYGGAILAMLGMINLIRADGNIDGVLTGPASSAHAAIWAACQRRYVHPLTYIGVHQANQSDNTLSFERTYELTLHKMKWVNEQMAQVFTRASHETYDWWLAQLLNTDAACQLFDAAKLVEMGMALPVEYRVPDG